MGKILTYNNIIQNITEKYSGEYKLLTKSSIIKSRTPIQIIHKCGEIIDTNYQSFVNESKGRCLKCYPPILLGKRKSLTMNEIRKRLNNKYTLLTQETRTKVLVLLKCNTCNNTFTSNLKDIFQNKSGCPVCANEKRGTYAQVEGYLNKLLEDSIYNDSNDYQWLEEYKNDNKMSHKIKHLVCNTIYSVRPNDFQQGYRCPECNCVIPKVSRNHLLIRDSLKKLNIPFIEEYTDVRCKYKNILRFDFAITLKTGKILLLEYDGEFHFSSSGLLSVDTYNNAILRDEIKNQFVIDNSNEYIIERINYKDSTLDRLVNIIIKYNLDMYCLQ